MTEPPFSAIICGYHRAIRKGHRSTLGGPASVLPLTHACNLRFAARPAGLVSLQNDPLENAVTKRKTIRQSSDLGTTGRLRYEAVIFMASLRASAPDWTSRVIIAEPLPEAPGRTRHRIADPCHELLGRLGVNRPLHGPPLRRRLSAEQQDRGAGPAPADQPFLFMDTDVGDRPARPGAVRLRPPLGVDAARGNMTPAPLYGQLRGHLEVDLRPLRAGLRANARPLSAGQALGTLPLFQRRVVLRCRSGRNSGTASSSGRGPCAMTLMMKLACQALEAVAGLRSCCRWSSTASAVAVRDGTWLVWTAM